MSAPAGYSTVTASALGGSNNLVQNATIYFQPVLNTGTETSARIGGPTQGQMTKQRFSATVTNGVFTLIVPDTHLTNPQYVGYSVTCTDNESGEDLLGCGYECVQPTGDPWSFDSYTPNSAPQALQVVGQGFNDRGLWAPNTVYHPYDIYSQAGSTYRVTTTYTSGASFGSADTTNSSLMAAAGSLTAAQAVSLRETALPSVRRVNNPANVVTDSLVRWTDGSYTTYGSGSGFYRTGRFGVVPGQQYVASAATTFGDTTLGWSFTDVNGSFVGGVQGCAANTPVTAPSGAVFGEVGFNSSGGSSSAFAVYSANAVPASPQSFGFVDAETAAQASSTQAVALLKAVLPAVRRVNDPTHVVADSLVHSTDGSYAAYGSGSGFYRTGRFGVFPGQQYVASAATTFSDTTLGWSFTDVNGSFVGGVQGCAANTPVTAPSGAVFGEVGFSSTSGSSSVFAVYSASAVPASPQSFGFIDSQTATQVSSILSSDSVLTVASAKTNYFDSDKGVSGCVNTDGSVNTVYFTYSTSPWTFCYGFGNLAINQAVGGESYQPFMVFGDINKNPIGSIPLPGTAGQVIPVPASAYYFRVSCQASNASTFAVNAGTASYPYEPPIGKQSPYLPSRWLGQNYACIGDSITANGIENDKGYQYAVANQLGAVLSISCGQSGHMMVEVLNYSGFTSAIDSTSMAAIALATIFLGTNDFGNNIPLGSATDAANSTSSATFFAAIDAIINTLLGWNPLLRIVFITPPQRATGLTANTQGHILLDYVNAIIAKCQQYALPYIDLYRLSGINPATFAALLDEYTPPDGLHPGNVGYARAVNPMVVNGLAVV